MSRVLIFADAHFSACHRRADGQPHGHTWSVRAWELAGGDAVALQTRLRLFLAQWDETLLPDQLWSAEAIATAIGEELRLFAVDVWRGPEGHGARWEA